MRARWTSWTRTWNGHTPLKARRIRSRKVHHGRDELEKAIYQLAQRGLRPELEEVVAAGDQVILVMRTPGLGQYLSGHADDRTYDVVTVRDGRIVELHACRDHGEARLLAGIS